MAKDNRKEDTLAHWNLHKVEETLQNEPNKMEAQNVICLAKKSLRRI